MSFARCSVFNVFERGYAGFVVSFKIKTADVAMSDSSGACTTSNMLKDDLSDDIDVVVDVTKSGGIGSLRPRNSPDDRVRDSEPLTVSLFLIPLVNRLI